jgi:hypothetical protein
VKGKPLAVKDVVVDITRFMWEFDEFQYSHSRWLLYIGFLQAASTYWGLRPGEWLESSCWQGSNEGLHYGDVKPVVTRDKSTGLLQWSLLVYIRFRKGRRDDETKP